MFRDAEALSRMEGECSKHLVTVTLVNVCFENPHFQEFEVFQNMREGYSTRCVV